MFLQVHIGNIIRRNGIDLQPSSFLVLGHFCVDEQRLVVFLAPFPHPPLTNRHSGQWLGRLLAKALLPKCVVHVAVPISL